MRRPGADEWKKLIAEYETSGLSHKDFVAKHDVSFGTFQFWLYRTRRAQMSRTSDSKSESLPRFLPLEVVASPPRNAGETGVIEVAMRSGAMVRFPVGTDTRYLAELLAALG